MATPEEQKATLHANRRSRPVLPTQKTTSATTSNDPHGRRSILQSNQLKALTLASALALAPSPSNQTDKPDETAQYDAYSQEEDSLEEIQAQQAQQLAGIQAMMSMQAQQQAQAQQTQQADEQTRQQQEKIKRVTRSALEQGIAYTYTLLGAAIDMSTFGISFFVNAFGYLLVFVWSNIKMIVGNFFTKGRSRIISPLSWDPIPMPIDKNAIILCGFILTANIMLALAALTFSFGGVCTMHDFSIVTSSITEAAEIGASLAQGQIGGLCFGGIISSLFGL